MPIYDDNYPRANKKIEYKVTESGCWECTSHQPNTQGYTVIRREKTLIELSHWVMNRGRLPKGQIIIRSCKNRACFNPEHLTIGSYLSLLNESFSEETGKNEGKSHLDLTKEKYRRIETLLKEGVKQAEIAKRENVSQNLVSRIKRGKSKVLG